MGTTWGGRSGFLRENDARSVGRHCGKQDMIQPLDSCFQTLPPASLAFLPVRVPQQLGAYSLLRPGEYLPQGSTTMCDLQSAYRTGDPEGAPHHSGTSGESRRS